MADRANGVVGWFKNLVGRSEASSSEPPTVVSLGLRALENCEMLVADAICRDVRSVVPGGDAAPARNAFDRTVVLRDYGDARRALAAASGFALSGLRTVVFMPAERLVECSAQLRSAVEQHLPLVIQATAGADGGAGLDAAAASGAFVLAARDAQQATDLTWTAHLTAERSLTPGVVVLDGEATAWTLARIGLPDGERLRDLVGIPGGEIDCPTQAQSVIFGDRRRRLPRWFDLDHPLACGTETTARDGATAAAARRLLFAAHVASIYEESSKRVAAATARSLPAIEGVRLEEARHVIVGPSCVTQVAVTVAERLRGPAGVLSLTRLNPFPHEEVRAALSRAESLTVLERREAAPGSTMLFDRVRAAVADRGVRVLSATYQRPVAAEIAAVFANMAAGDSARQSVQLGVRVPGDAPEHPRRQALVQRSRRDYPELESGTLAPCAEVDDRAPGSKTVLLRVASAAFPESSLVSLARKLEDSVGAHLVGRSEQLEPGVWQLWLTASAEPSGDPGAGVRADVALIAHPGLISPLDTLAEDAVVIVASESAGETLWRSLPPRSKRAIRRAGQRLFRAADVESLLDGGMAIAAGRPGDLEEIAWKNLADAPERQRGAELPFAVRRLGGSMSGPDSVARFWGEFAQPRRDDVAVAAELDPHLALGTVPACTASFHEASAERERVPSIDADACTGCGKCWVSCPDSAIGAVAISPQALLDAAAERSAAPDPDPAAGRLKRAHRQLAARWAGALTRSAPGAVPASSLDESFSWLVDTMKVADEERPAFKRAFEATRDWIVQLPFGTTPALFHDPEKAQQGSGALLLLAIDSRACQSCGICAAVCPDEAIRMEADVAAHLPATRSAWAGWEALPDTSGKSIARAADDRRIGRLGAVLLSRHCLASLVGGDGAEPGSGERVAVRQVSAVIEYQMQRLRLSQVERLQELSTALRERIGRSLSQAISVDDLRTLDDALDATSAPRAPLGQVVARMEELGERTDVDVPAVRGLVRTAQELEGTTERIAHGLSGAGRARYGVVVSGVRSGSWMATYPRNPFSVPVALDRTGSGAGLALGLADGFLAECVREALLVRRAELLLDAPSDLPARQRELAGLGWLDLTSEERRLCPPILLFAGSEFDGGVADVLSSELPIKLILLDPANLGASRPDLLLPALANADAFVASTSIAHPEHLFDSVSAALDFGGPAMIRVHAPSPSRDGFAPAETIGRARLAVDCRVNPLLRFDPPEDGGIGRGIDLVGNPAVNATWTHDEQGERLTPAVWAAGETRFAEDPEQAGSVLERARHWATLQELAGISVPFAAKLEARLEQTLQATHQAELDALRAEYEGKLLETEQRQTRSQAVRLRDRLMQLAGYSSPEGGAPDSSKDQA